VTSPSDDRWGEALAAFEELVNLDAASRQTRLNAIGASDPELQRAVEQLLAADSQADAILLRVDADLGEAAPDPDPLHLIGRTVSHFRIVEPIARGGMGVVYRAEDLQLGRPVALKVPLAARYVDREAIERFRQEARAAAVLDHPNLCPVYETGETADGDLFYTMPFYEGETLKARLAREGRLPLPQALDIATRLTRGLGAAHQAGIVHRDLKPANVMLLPDGGVKILDFGLAKASDLTLTGSWARLGTIAYMAPEQVHGHKVDPRADLWALGVVLYEMVSGSRPFGGGHEIGVAHAILYDPLPQASTVRDEIPAELDDVIERCLRKDPAERPQSAEELATALGEVRLDQGAPLLRRLRRARMLVARRGRWRMAMIVAMVGLVAAAGAGLARRRTAATLRPVSLAVLPFDRQGDSAATDYMAVGLSDGIGTELRRLRGVIAPGYVTASNYRASPKSPQQIGTELEVGAVLRGTLQRADDRLRVDAQLLGAGDGRQLWARRYERSASELQEIQRDIVRATLATLRIRPTKGEQDLLSRPPAINPSAYDTYLQGRAIELAGDSRTPWRPFPPDNIRRAMSLYSRARDLDPRFAAARARLALMHTLAAATYDTTEGRREQARVEAEIALRLRPDLPEPHEALASYWSLRGDAAKSIEELGLALAAFPNSADLRRAHGVTLTSAGRYDEGVAELEQAVQLEPTSLKATADLATTYSRLRRREEAVQALDRAIALGPEFHPAKVIKGLVYLRWKGTSDTLAALMERVPPDWDPDGVATYCRYVVFSVQRRYADGLAMLDQSRSQLYRDGLLFQPTSLMRAQFYEALGNRKMAQASYAAANSVIQDSIDAHPADPSIRVALGLAYAGLGRTADAVREARRAMELAPVAGVAGDDKSVMAGAAEVYAKAGEIDAALDLLELLFSMPAGREVSVPLLRVWPGFDPLRKDPRFEELLTRFAAAR
jgi:TolB-like protein/Flp pilus assembly protein TadD/tRNA A-37 threonylcarbamoyl transferase component Bud32